MGHEALLATPAKTCEGWVRQPRTAIKIVDAVVHYAAVRGVLSVTWFKDRSYGIYSQVRDMQDHCADIRIGLGNEGRL